MAKDSSGNGKKGAGDNPDRDDDASAWDAIPKALKEAGQRATDLAQNPYARSLLAAGLVTAAAALAANKNVRDATRRNLKDATEAAEVAADSAGKIGAAIINAATEAVQRMITLGADAAGGAASKPQAATAGKKSGASAPAPARKRTTKSADASAAASAKSQPRKKASGGTGNSGAAKPRSPSTPRARKTAGSSAGKAAGKKSGATTTGSGTGKSPPKQGS